MRDWARNRGVFRDAAEVRKKSWLSYMFVDVFRET